MARNNLARIAKLEETKKTTVTFVMVSMRRLPKGELSSFGEDVAYLLADGEEVDMAELSESVQYIMILPEKDSSL